MYFIRVSYCRTGYLYWAYGHFSTRAIRTQWSRSCFEIVFNSRFKRQFKQLQLRKRCEINSYWQPKEFWTQVSFSLITPFFKNIYGHYFCTRAFRCTMGSKLLWNRFQFSIYVSVNSWDSFLKTIYVEKIREIFSVYCKSWIFLRRPQKFDEINRFFD